MIERTDLDDVFTQLLAGGDHAALEAHLRDSAPFLIVATPGGSVDSIAAAINDALPAERLRAEWDGTELALTYGHQPYGIPLTAGDGWLPALVGLRAIVSPEYAVKVVRSSLGSAAPRYYVRAMAWWSAAEQHDLALLSTLFADLPEGDLATRPRYTPVADEVALQADPALFCIVTGDADGLEAYLDESPPFTVGADHGGWEEDIVRYVAAAVPDEDIAVETDYSGDRPHMTVRFNGETYQIALTRSGEDRIITTRALQAIIAPRYTVKLIRSSFLSDTWCYYVRPTAWWTRAEQENRSLVQAMFEDIPSDARARWPIEMPAFADEVPPAQRYPPVYTVAAMEADQLTLPSTVVRQSDPAAE